MAPTGLEVEGSTKTHFICLAGQHESDFNLGLPSQERMGRSRVLPLCRRAQEDSQHLLIHCVFTKDVWSRILKHLKLSTSWSGDTITDCFSSWLSNKALPIPLAVYTCWHLWTERNNALFEDRSPSTQAVFHRVLASFSWQPSTLKHFIHKEIDLSLPEGYTLACFDGAAQANGSCCGAGGFFRAIRRGSQSGCSIVDRVLTQKRS
jgi:hypothetical protein